MQDWLARGIPNISSEFGVGGRTTSLLMMLFLGLTAAASEIGSRSIEEWLTIA